MQALRRLIKLFIAYGLYYSGVLYLLCRIRLRGRAVVLTYHRVIADDKLALSHSSPGIIVHKDVFEQHFTVIKRYLKPLSIEQFQEYFSARKPLPNRSCLLTFDDGWLDNYETALPILLKHRVPAVIFLPFNYVSSKQMFWQEELMLRLSYLLSTDNREDHRFVKELAALEHNPRSEQLRDYVSALKSKSNPEINAILQLVRGRCHDNVMPDHYDRYMSWEQILEMQRKGISFGSHTLSHRILTNVSRDECSRELNDSKALLEAALGMPVETIAYPNGDHSEQVDALTEQAGYTLGFTTEPGYVSSDTNAFTIPRINIHNNSSCNKAVFLCTIMGIF